VTAAPADVVGDRGDVDVATDGDQTAHRLGRLRPDAGRCFRPPGRRPRQHAVDGREASVPRLGLAHALDELGRRASPHRFEGHDGGHELAGRHPEQRPRPGRRDVQLHAALVAVVLDDGGRGVEPTDQGFEPLRLRTAVGQPAQRDRRIELHDEREVPGRQAHVPPGQEAAHVVARVAVDVVAHERVRPAGPLLGDRLPGHVSA
jgi:hypothetical protein